MSSACTPNYTKLMRKSVQSTVGCRGIFGTLSCDSYTWFDYPTDNFGLGTTFVLPNPSATPSEDYAVCAMWSCIGVPRPEEAAERRAFGGFAEVGGNGGQITLTETTQRQIGGSFVLPEVYKLLKIEATAVSKRTQTNRLQMGRVYPRLLNRIRYNEYIRALSPGDPRKAALEEGRLAVAVADYMIDSMDVDIHVDQKADATLNAALTSSLGSVLQASKENQAKLSVSVSGGTNGTYHLTVTNPVILSTYIKQQAGTRTGGVPTEEEMRQWVDWKAVPPALTSVKK